MLFYLGMDYWKNPSRILYKNHERPMYRSLINVSEIIESNKRNLLTENLTNILINI